MLATRPVLILTERPLGRVSKDVATSGLVVRDGQARLLTMRSQLCFEQPSARPPSLRIGILDILIRPLILAGAAQIDGIAERLCRVAGLLLKILVLVERLM